MLAHQLPSVVYFPPQPDENPPGKYVTLQYTVELWPSWYEPTVILTFLSVSFSLASFLVYALVEKLRDLHGKCLMCYVASLLVANTSVVIFQCNAFQIIGSGYCNFFAFTIQFSYMASFFWLNIMFYGLWSNVRGFPGMPRDHETKTFKIYSIYSWGCTCFISVFTLYIKSSSNNNYSEYREKPCWLASDTDVLLYLFCPIGVIIFANLLMSVHTTVMILSHTRLSTVLNGSESNRRVDLEKQRFCVILFIFIVMDVSWSAAILYFYFGFSSARDVADIVYKLLGMLIFLIFVCNKRVIKLLFKKLCRGNRCLAAASKLSSQTFNDFSDGNFKNCGPSDIALKHFAED